MTTRWLLKYMPSERHCWMTVVAICMNTEGELETAKQHPVARSFSRRCQDARNNVIAPICLAGPRDRNHGPVVLDSKMGVTPRCHQMDEILTVGEMESKFVGEWLLVEDPRTDEALQVLSGKVRFHSEDRDQVYRKAVELRPRRFAVLYTGSISKDAAVVL